MVNKNNFLSIRVFHEDEIKNFLNKILLIFRKYKLKMNYYKKKKKCLKNTILRSPHVNKTARDQIELYSIEYFFDISKNNNNLLNFFLFILKKYINSSLRIKIRKIRKQTLLFKPFHF